jgi:DNA-binding NarL/FixJ family response regulator
MTMTDTAAPIGVLICDDVEEIRELLTAIVGLRANLQVLGEAATGKQAIFEAQRLQPDVILLDLSMPGITGYDALPAIKNAAPAAYVIVLSGFAAEVVADDVLAQGADQYIEKGAAPAAIADAIEKAGVAARFVRAGATTGQRRPPS